MLKSSLCKKLKGYEVAGMHAQNLSDMLRGKPTCFSQNELTIALDSLNSATELGNFKEMQQSLMFLHSLYQDAMFELRTIQLHIHSLITALLLCEARGKGAAFDSVRKAFEGSAEHIGRRLKFCTKVREIFRVYSEQRENAWNEHLTKAGAVLLQLLPVMGLCLHILGKRTEFEDYVLSAVELSAEEKAQIRQAFSKFPKWEWMDKILRCVV